jgi:alkylation response protein AidB-like acyl-CoA dehydrogenase
MKFDFDEDQRFIRNDARRFLADRCPMEDVRQHLTSDPSVVSPLWREICELGWPGAAISEAYGGLGMGYLELCVLAEELGRVVAPVPFSSSIYLAAEAILQYGSEEQKQQYLPRLASGEIVGTLAWSDSGEKAVALEGGSITGVKRPVAGGTLADIAVVSAVTPENKHVLVLVELAEIAAASGKCIQREMLKSADPSVRNAQLTFDDCPVQILGNGEDSFGALRGLLDQAAVLLAFEQIGGADRCLELAVDYVKERKTFGRAVGSYQAVKHKLARMYAQNELARSNAYYGAWALASESEELPIAASAARISATECFEFAAREGLHLHGGMGYTWEVDCHLYLKRSRDLALRLGGLRQWKEKLVSATLAATRSPATTPTWLANS